jgi:hypothetical protein
MVARSDLSRLSKTISIISTGIWLLPVGVVAEDIWTDIWCLNKGVRCCNDVIGVRWKLRSWHRWWLVNVNAFVELHKVVSLPNNLVPYFLPPTANGRNSERTCVQSLERSRDRQSSTSQNPAVEHAMKSFWTCRKSSHSTAVFQNVTSRQELQHNHYCNTEKICFLRRVGAEFNLDIFISGGLLELIVK